MLLTIIAFVLILSFLVFVHEFGHYFFALKFGMKVEEFAIGMGPKLFQKISQKTEIVYSIRAIPIGGFCKIKGEDGAEEAEIKNNEHTIKEDLEISNTEIASTIKENSVGDSFGEKKIWQRAIVLFAGVFMNFIVATIFIYIILITGFTKVMDGSETNNKNVFVKNEGIKVYDVYKGSNADKNKIKAGYNLISIDNTNFKNIEDLRKYINEKDQIKLKLENNNKQYDFVLNKEFNENLNESIFGISFENIGTVKYGILKAVPETFDTMVSLVGEMFYGLKYLLSNIFSGRGIPDGMSGPIGIAVITGDVIRMGYSHILNFIALLSLNLAIINILPFPALDGGRILFLIFEKIKGKHLNQKFEMISNLVGFLLLIILIIAVSFKDIFTFIIK